MNTSSNAATTDATRAEPPASASGRGPGLAPGLVVAALTAVVATLLGRLAPLVGAPVFGIVIGVGLGALLRARAKTLLAPGWRYSSSRVLQTSVVVLGTQLSLGQVFHIGVSSLPVMVGTLAACLVVAAVVGRWMGVDGELRTLIGVGTGICGASAIAAASSVIKPKHGNVAYAISTIFLFNVLAVLLFPPLGHLLHMSQDGFGLFAGTAVNDTSSVVAAATTFGKEAGNHAVVVKLTRTLMIIPICLALSAIVARRKRLAAGPDAQRGLSVTGVTRLVPWFLIGFLVCAAIGSTGLITHGPRDLLQELAMFLITMALAAIGYSTDVAGLRRTGPRPLVLGAVLWVTVASVSLLLQAV